MPKQLLNEVRVNRHTEHLLVGGYGVCYHGYYTGRGHKLSFALVQRSGWGRPVPIGVAQLGTSRPHPDKKLSLLPRRV